MCITGLTWAENRSDMDCEQTRWNSKKNLSKQLKLKGAILKRP